MTRDRLTGTIPRNSLKWSLSFTELCFSRRWVLTQRISRISNLSRISSGFNRYISWELVEGIGHWLPSYEVCVGGNIDVRLLEIRIINTHILIKSPFTFSMSL